MPWRKEEGQQIFERLDEMVNALRRIRISGRGEVLSAYVRSSLLSLWLEGCCFEIDPGPWHSYNLGRTSSPLNESSSNQFQIDFLTGAPTGFNSRVVAPDEWRATGEVNRKRSGSLKAIHGQSASWGEVSPDVWAQRVPEQAGALEVPVVDLLAIGIDAGEFGELISLVPGLERLDCG